MSRPDEGGGARPLKNAILIAGPTASGKSALALKLAIERGGVIVNTDSMQVYSGLQVLTARPSEEDMAAAPHRLYGHVDPERAYSTGAWLREVEDLIGRGELEGRPAIFVGGTGLYFRALLGGLSDMPDIPADIRFRWREALAEQGASRLHQLLAERDLAAAAAIRTSDGQRIVRALEVHEATGRSITTLQAAAGSPLVDEAGAERYVIQPDRALLHARIEQRFDRMVKQGALDEVRALMARRLDPALPAMKAIGIRELMAAIRGEAPLADSVEKAKAATRQYAKRQMTWFRNQLGRGWITISGEVSRRSRPGR